MMKTLTTVTLLAAMLICSACGTNSQKTALNPTETHTQLVSSLNWEQATAASSAASVSNNSLIMMR